MLVYGEGVKALRECSRAQCVNPAVATLTYNYQEATAVLGPLSSVHDPAALDLCEYHAASVTAPAGWQMMTLVDNFEPAPPSQADLLVLADKIRQAARRHVDPPQMQVRRFGRTGVSSAPPTHKDRSSFRTIDGGQ